MKGGTKMRERARSKDISRMIAEGGLGADTYYESDARKKKESPLVSSVPSEHDKESKEEK